MSDYPKWVTPHESYIHRQRADGAPDHVSTPAWPSVHVGRDGAVTVLVADQSEEERAVSPEHKSEV